MRDVEVNVTLRVRGSGTTSIVVSPELHAPGDGSIAIFA